MDVHRPATDPLADGRPGLRVLRLRLPAAPLPLVLRRDRPHDARSRALDVADVLRYVGAARRTLRGPLIAQIEGPGDPLASPGTVLRALALVREHDPDVMAGLVIDGPLFAEYVDELVDLAIHHVVIRMDAWSLKTARRVYGRVAYRGELLAGAEAGRLVLEEGRRAVRLAVANRIPVALRFTAIPTVNSRDLAAIAAFAAAEGVERVDVVAHDPLPGAPLAKAGMPTAEELDACREEVARAYARAFPEGLPQGPGAFSWLVPGRTTDVALSSLDHVDALSLLPDPEKEEPEEAPILPPRRALMVAVASTDGSFVDLSLADAAHIQVYAVGRERTRWLGTRTLPTDWQRRRDGVGAPEGILRAVAGCGAVVSTRFTAKAATLLSAVGVRACPAGGHVDDVLDRISRGTLPSERDARGRTRSGGDGDDDEDEAPCPRKSLVSPPNADWDA